jgi:integral membrane protein
MDVSPPALSTRGRCLLKPHWTVPALRWTAIVETVSFVALMVAVVLDSERGVSVLGMTHGLMFMAYAVLVLAVRTGQCWSWGFTALAIIGGPIAALFVPERLRDPAPAAIPEEIHA